MPCRHAFVALLLVNFCTAAFVQPPQVPSNELSAAVHIADSYIAQPNIAYVTAQNYRAKLDIYRPAKDTASPVVIYIHGGGWVNGTKEDVVMETLPFMAMGFAVINVEYRLARISPAPAAVEDCLCVLHWVGRHAKEYSLDLDKVIVAGSSAGGHLALTTAVIPTSAGLEAECRTMMTTRVVQICGRIIGQRSLP